MEYYMGCCEACNCDSHKYPIANYIFYNAEIYSLDDNNNKYAAIAIKDNKIIFLGEKSEVWKFCEENITKTINLYGKVMMPSFTDAHVHTPGQYLCNYDLDLSPYISREEYVEAVKKYTEKNPKMEIIYGSGWSISYFSGDDKRLGPSMDYLNEIETDKPIVLYSVDRHTAWLNQKALDKFKITKDTGKEVGKELTDRIVKNDDGELRGIVVEDAMCYIPTKRYSDKQIIESFLKFQKDMHSLGITNINAIGVEYLNGFFSPEEYRRIIDNKLLKLRISYAGNITSNKVKNGKVLDIKEQVYELVELRKNFEGKSQYFKVTAGKLFIDGVVEGLTAYLTSPYEYKASGAYDNYGDFLWKNNEENYKEAIGLLNANELQAHNHSIGDAATKFILDSFESLGQDLKKKCRNIVTHLQVVRKSDIRRMRELGVVAVTQPYWGIKAPGFWESIEHIPLGERAEYEYPLKSLLDESVITAGSSDLPVTIPPNPIVGIERGVTRMLCDEEGFHINDDTLLNKQERVPVIDMIRMFTVNGAYSTFRETEIGTLEVGKKADLVVLSKNIFEIPQETIHTAKVEMTMFDGEIVYTMDSQLD